MAKYGTCVTHPGPEFSDQAYSRIGVHLEDADDEVVLGPIFIRDYTDLANPFSNAVMEAVVIAARASLHLRQAARELIATVK